MEASALSQASRRGLLGRGSPLLRLQSDEKLVELIRDRQERAFEVLFDRYRPRLLAFCRHMLPSEQDAEDILQDVFVAAYHAMLADERALNVRPWLYRIARNRCLNHLRRRTAEGQDSMDVHVYANGISTAEQVQNREELRALLRDVRTLPETQRTALLLRECDGLPYAEIAQSMGTTVPAVKSLLVRARVTLGEASQARLLSCAEVHLQLAEAAEGLRKVEGPVRHHLRDCEDCRKFREQLQSNSRALAALFPLGPLAALKAFLLGKLGIGGGSGGGVAAGGSAAGAGGSAVAGGGAVASGGAAMAGGAAGGAVAGGGAITGALGGFAAGGGAGGIGGAVTGVIGAKAAAGMATAALLTAGAVEVKNAVHHPQPAPVRAASESVAAEPVAQDRAGGPEAIREVAVTEADAPPALPEDLAPAPEPEVAPVSAEEELPTATGGAATTPAGEPAAQGAQNTAPTGNPAGALPGAHGGPSQLAVPPGSGTATGSGGGGASGSTGTGSGTNTSSGGAGTTPSGASDGSNAATGASEEEADGGTAPPAQTDA